LSNESRVKYTAHSFFRLLFILSSLVALSATFGYGATTARVSGAVFTIGSDQVMTTWPGARVTLKNKQTQNAVSTVANERGEYAFVGVDPGEYELTVALEGFETEVRTIKLEPKANLRVDIQLRPKTKEEQVVVQSRTQGVETTPTVLAGPELHSKVLQSLPLLNDSFQDALPLIPGVVRGPDGSINMKGGRANQSSTLLNSTNVADPVTGQAVIEVPLGAIESVRVLANPFSSEYGRFAGGVVELETKSGTDQWNFSLDGFFPRMRYRSGHIIGIENITPRETLSGPLVKGKLYFFESTEYRFIRTKVSAQPDLRNDQVFEALESITQFDWNINANHRFTGTALVYPQYLQFIGMNAFNPEEVTPNTRQHGYFVGLGERAIFSSGGFLETNFSAKRLDNHIYPSHTLLGEDTLFPEQNFGTYFGRQDRLSHLYQWAQTYHHRPVQAHGTHLIEAGYSFARADYSGTVNNSPVLVLREDRTASESIAYTSPSALQAQKNEFALFVQDRWQLHPQLTLDAGVRIDRDDLSRDPVDVAPRFAFVFAPTRDNKTAVRGGVGLFYDKIPLNVATFRAYPEQIVTRFASDGITVIDGPVLFVHTVAAPGGQLYVPYSLSWNFQLDRVIRRGLMFRFGYEQRETHRDLVIEPLETGSNAALVLSNSGRQSYREFQWTLRWEPTEHMLLFSSFTRSRATGNLNGFDQFFNSFPNPIIRPDERGLLPYDAPNRFLFWGYTTIFWKLEFAPVLEIRNGFPFSKVDNDLNFVGPRNGAGRFPTFGALDFQLARLFLVHSRHKTYGIKPGVRFFNVTNRDNPRDVQQNIASPYFGAFYNSVQRLFRWRIDFDVRGSK
jgi:outer membrane receptor protein involved in Fe transport